jgi:NADH:ubiquinone oxidoreductase subunit 5 (subunit L)/multisubunit Na+/H+ antiporter MnhA subunit
MFSSAKVSENQLELSGLTVAVFICSFYISSCRLTKTQRTGISLFDWIEISAFKGRFWFPLEPIINSMVFFVTGIGSLIPYTLSAT